MRLFHLNLFLVQYTLYLFSFALDTSISDCAVDSDENANSLYWKDKRSKRSCQHRFSSDSSLFRKSHLKPHFKIFSKFINSSIEELASEIFDENQTLCLNCKPRKLVGSKKPPYNTSESDTDISTNQNDIPSIKVNSVDNSEHRSRNLGSRDSRAQNTKFPSIDHTRMHDCRSEAAPVHIPTVTNVNKATHSVLGKVFYISIPIILIFAIYSYFAFLHSKVSVALTSDASLLMPSTGNSLYLVVPLSDDDLRFLNSSQQDPKPTVLVTSKSHPSDLDVKYIKFYVFDVSPSQKDSIEMNISNDISNEYITLKILPISTNNLKNRVLVLERLYTTGMFHRDNTKSYSPSLDAMSKSLVHVTVSLDGSFWKRHLTYMLGLVECFEARLDITDLGEYSAFLTPKEIQMIRSSPGIIFVQKSVFFSLDSYPVLSADEASKRPKPICDREPMKETSLWHLMATGVMNEDLKRMKIISRDSDKDVYIFLIDSGIYDHEDLNESIIPNSKYAYSVYDDENPYNDALGHGTQLAGIIKGKTVGIAPDAFKIEIVPIRIFSDKGCEIYKDSQAAYEACNLEPKILTHDKIRKALRYILKLLRENNNGIKDKICVINYSINGTDSPEIFNHVVEDILKFPNVYFVASAGNNGLSKDSSDPGKFYPAIIKRTPDGERLIVAAASAVAKKNKEIQKIYPSSGYGPLVDFIAPGEYIYSSFKDSNLERGCFAPLYGTSPATAFVSTLVAITGSKIEIQDDNTIVNEMMKHLYLKDVSNQGHTLKAYVIAFDDFVEDALIE